MSYCRGNYCYIFRDETHYHCLGHEGGRCNISGTRVFATPSARTMMNHMLDHVQRGDPIPKYAFRRISDEVFAELKLKGTKRKVLK